MKHVGGVASIPRSNFTRTRYAATCHAFPGGFRSRISLPPSLSVSPFTDQRLKSCRESFCGTERLMSARVPTSLARANSVRLWIKRAIDDSFRSLNLGQIRSNRNGIAAPLKGGEFIFFFLTRANTLSNNESIADETFQFVSCFFELVNRGDELILQRFDHVSFT